MRELRCRDVGFDCAGVVRAGTEEEVLLQAAEHARSVHGLTQLDADTVRQIRARIRVVEA